MPGHVGYLICTTPRSGSNWFCSLLAGTGVLGWPLEYFNGESRRELDDREYPLDPRGQVDQVVTRGATPNGVYGLKLFATQFLRVSAAVQLAELLPSPQWVWLRRQDLLGQALSMVRAAQSGQFRSTLPAQSGAAYDRPAILTALRLLAREDLRWQVFFATYGISPLMLWYEEIMADPARAIAAVARIVQVTGALDPSRTAGGAGMPVYQQGLSIQRDDLTEAWRRRFLDEGGGSYVMDPLSA